MGLFVALLRKTDQINAAHVWTELYQLYHIDKLASTQQVEPDDVGPAMSSL